MLRQIFEDLAHVSIMKLNKTSMDKLYDLMNMTFKYQVFKCKSPNDILRITFNHLDAIREFAQSSILHSQLNHAYSMFHQVSCKVKLIKCSKTNDYFISELLFSYQRRITKNQIQFIVIFSRFKSSSFTSFKTRSSKFRWNFYYLERGLYSFW